MPLPFATDAYVSREDYFRWAETQPHGRCERIDGRVVAMPPERGAHLRVKAAVWLALRDAIRTAGVDCQALPDGATVPSGDSDYEPDALVNAGPPIADDAIVAPNPVIVVEVLSPTTQGIDTGAKLTGYFAVPSIRHYLIVHPTKRLVVHHRRSEAAVGHIDTVIVTSGEIRLDPPGLTVDVAQFYA
jgi:Uma2 family endonuclease